MDAAGRFGEPVPPTGPPTLHPQPSSIPIRPRHPSEDTVAADTVSSLLFTGPLAWTVDAECAGQTDLFFAPAGERPETRLLRESRARAICLDCAVVDAVPRWAREHREYGFWGGESEEDRAAAGYRVDMPVGRVARYPKGNGKPVQPPRAPRRLSNPSDVPRVTCAGDHRFGR